MPEKVSFVRSVTIALGIASPKLLLLAPPLFSGIVMRRLRACRVLTVNFTTLYSKVAANEENLAACVWDLQFAPGIDADPEPAVFESPSTRWHWIEVRFKSMGPTAARKLRNLAVSESTWATPSSDPTTLSKHHPSVRAAIRFESDDKSKSVMNRFGMLSPRHAGFALVITLIMITLLAIMALAFLFSSSLDQSTSLSACE